MEEVVVGGEHEQMDPRQGPIADLQAKDEANEYGRNDQSDADAATMPPEPRIQRLRTEVSGPGDRGRQA